MTLRSLPEKPVSKKTSIGSASASAVESRRVARAGRLIGGISLVSRILGYVRDVLLAGFFGAGWVADAVITAFRLPNLIRRLFSEGGLSMAFVPEFIRFRRHHGQAAAAALARRAFQRLALWLVVLIIVGMVAAPLLVKALAAGFETGSPKFDLTVGLIRIMLPFVFFVSLSALAMGIFHSYDRFAVPALAPVVLNILMIIIMVAVAAATTRAVNRAVGLAAGVTAGGLFQLLIHLPTLRRLIARPSQPKAKVRVDFTPTLSRMARLTGPAAIGASSLNFSLMVTHWMASWQMEGSIAHLYYADRLIQFPLGIFSVALGIAALPSLSRQALQSDLQALRQTYQSGLQLVLFITVPAMVGLLLLREPIVGLLFHHGAFDALAVARTSRTLLIYGTGLWAFAGIRMAVSVLNALDAARLTARIAFAAVGLNLVLSLLIVGKLGYDGLILMLTATGIFNFLALVIAIHRRLGALQWQLLALSLIKTGVCTFFMGGSVALCFYGLPRLTGAAFQVPGLVLILAMILGILVFGATARWLNCEEMEQLLAWRTRKNHQG